ncbi:MAG: hypothetical protein AB1760_19470 [Pseudomonadota bacterium]
MALAAAAALSLGGFACGGDPDGSTDGAGDGGSGLAPIDYDEAVRRADEAADQAEERAREVEEEVRRQEEGYAP